MAIIENAAQEAETRRRDVVFISKATPGDDEFVLWLAPRLEAAGYTVLQISSPLSQVTAGVGRSPAHCKTRQ